LIELLQITNNPELARICDRVEGVRVFVDLEQTGKAERQKGHDTFISTHNLEDVSRIKALLRRARLMVRVNPYQSANPAATKAEVDAVLAHGADMLMLPMFSNARELKAFAAIVAGRVPIVPLLETAGALQTLDSWLDTPGIEEVFVGLNDLHLSLGCRFMFEPLLQGHIDRVATATKARGLRFGFGGIARMDEGILPGYDVLAEHVRLGSSALILSRTFNRADTQKGDKSFEQAVIQLRQAELQLMQRSTANIEKDRNRTYRLITDLAASAKVTT
jgi:2-keto-3-deoxy-L-rhamnonate aldolase RhmA